MNSPSDRGELVAGLNEAFGQRMRRARTARKMSQQELAAILNDTYGFSWHQTTAGKIEIGERPARVTEAVAISFVLDVSLESLIFGVSGDGGDNAKSVELAATELTQVQEYVHMRLLRLHASPQDTAAATDAVSVQLNDQEVSQE